MAAKSKLVKIIQWPSFPTGSERSSKRKSSLLIHATWLLIHRRRQAMQNSRKHMAYKACRTVTLALSSHYGRMSVAC